MRHTRLHLILAVWLTAVGLAAATVAADRAARTSPDGLPDQSLAASQAAAGFLVVSDTTAWQSDHAISDTARAGQADGLQGDDPSLELTKTVSSNPGVCGSMQSVSIFPGDEVTYCYEMRNTGTVELVEHTLVDDQLGTLLQDFNLTLEPGETFVVSQTVELSESVTNLATWTALDDSDNTGMDSDSAFVLVKIPEIAMQPGSLFHQQPTNIIQTVVITVENPGTDTLNWSLSEVSGPGASLVDGQGQEVGDRASGAVGDVLFEVDGLLATSHSPLLGVEFAQEHFWITSGSGNSTDPNLLFKLDSTGTLVNTYEQTTTSPFGWRDLAFDGRYLYASESHLVQEIDPADGQPTGVAFPSPLGLVRGLAYDPAKDHFWVADFGNDIYEINRAGQVVDQIANPGGMNIYGLGWDDLSPGGPYLWAWSDNPARATQFDPATGLPTGLSFQGSNPPGELFSGGATISDAILPDKLVLIGLHQGGKYNITGYDLGVSTGICSSRNIPWTSASPTGASNAPGENVPVELTINTNGMQVGSYFGYLCILSNDPDQRLTVFPLILDVFLQGSYLPIIIR